MLDISKILGVVRQALNVTPEFTALVNAVADLADTNDQDVLKSALADAQERSDRLHEQVQAAADLASDKN